MRQYPAKRGQMPEAIEMPTEMPADEEEEKGKRSKRERDEILKEACTRFEKALSDDGDNRRDYRNNMIFAYTPNGQTPDDIHAQRATWKEPTLEFNQIAQFVHQVVNDQRQNRTRSWLVGQLHQLASLCD